MKEFRSAAGFAAHLTRLIPAAVLAEERGLDSAAAIIEREAKQEIGHYQRDNTGPFAQWAELADRTKEQRLDLGFTENDPGYRTGEMRDSISRTVRLNEAVVGSNDDHLVWFELGTSKQPPRSALGLAAYRKAGQAASLVGSHVSWAIAGLAPRNSQENQV